MSATPTLTAIILAGGLGTRLRSAVPDLPKPMAPLNGRPFLEYLMDYWVEQGVGRFILSVGYLREIIIGHFGNAYRTAKIDYACEDTPLGTGGALIQSAQSITPGEHFLLLNGDTYFAIELPPLLDFARTHGADCCFSLFRANEADRYMAMEAASDGRITRLKNGRSVIGSLANGGVYCLRRSTLMEESHPPGQRCSFEDDLLPAAQQAGRKLYGREFDAPFIDIGVPADYQRAATMLA